MMNRVWRHVDIGGGFCGTYAAPGLYVLMTENAVFGSWIQLICYLRFASYVCTLVLHVYYIRRFV